MAVHQRETKEKPSSQLPLPQQDVHYLKPADSVANNVDPDQTPCLRRLIRSYTDCSDQTP